MTALSVSRMHVLPTTALKSLKSEETPQPLNNVLRASSEIIYKQDFSVLSYMLLVEWFEQYRKRMLEAEQLILTTLNFEINVQHPYGPLTTVLSKLGLSQIVLVKGKLIKIQLITALFADVETDEVYAMMTLQPLSPQEQKIDYLLAELGVSSKQPTNYFCETLTASDTSQPKRHLLTAGWSVFVSAKRLVAGDSVLFIKKSSGFSRGASMYRGVTRASSTWEF
ncbi:hypothetical protein ACFE04_019471 [Oxalis oulophora]